MYEELKNLASSDFYPFHMPGHKRRMAGFDPYSLDITEIDDFDNMHDPEGLIKRLNERLREVFGGEEAFILVNGSTSGVLAAVSSTVRPGGHILMARNSHKSAYNAAALRNLTVSYIRPELIPEHDLNGGIDPAKVEDILSRKKDIEAVFITSPTYEGIVSDIDSISRICHSRGIPLIVDSAHGAHGGLYEPFEREFGFRDSVAAGADIVIKSLHKTLPCFTQTAMAVVDSKYVDKERFRRYYSIYQTTSPSYIFMAGADRMMDLLEKEGGERFEKLDKELKGFRAEVEKLYNVSCFGPGYIGDHGVYGFDPTKILLSGEGMTGSELYDLLRKDHHLQPEMAAGDYVLMMTSLMDDSEGFKRLSSALQELKTGSGKSGKNNTSESRRNLVRIIKDRSKDSLKLSDALDMEYIQTDLSDAIGSVSAAFIYAYPPGIPVIVPGEPFTEETVREIENMIEKGLTLKGVDRE